MLKRYLSSGALYIVITLLLTAAAGQDFFQSRQPAAQVQVSAFTNQNQDQLQVVLVFNIPDNGYLYLEEDRFFKLNSVGKGILRIKTVYPEHKVKKEAGEKLKVLEGRKKIALFYKVKHKNWTLQLKVAYQACIGTVCLPPQTRVFTFKTAAVKSEDLQQEAADQPQTLNSLSPDSVIPRLQQIKTYFSEIGRTYGAVSVEDFSVFLKGKADNKSQLFKDRSLWFIILFTLLGDWL